MDEKKKKKENQFPKVVGVSFFFFFFCRSFFEGGNFSTPHVDRRHLELD